MNKKGLLIVLAAIAPLTACARGDVKFDGSLGAAGSLSGTLIAVPANRGQLRGANLFHSFSAFDVARSQTVDFVGPAGVKNVLIRVTGTGGSRIDGTLQSGMPGANFFLMNPNGVVFGSGAALKIDGSFAVTTASRLVNADGGSFEASTLRPSLLTAAPPAAFGFLGGEGGVRVDRATLRVPKGNTLSVVAGDIALTDDGQKATRTRLEAEAGRVNLVAVASAGQVELNAASTNSNIKTRAFPQLGNILVRGNGIVTTDGEAGGAIVIRAANLRLDGARIYSTTTGSGTGRDIDVALSESFVLQTRGGIFSSTEGTGDSGNVSLSAPRIDISAARIRDGEFSGVGSISSGLPVDANAAKLTAGDAGDVLIRGSSITLSANGKIASETFGRDGDGGNVRIDVGGVFRIDGAGGSFLTGVSTRTSPSPSPDANPSTSSVLLEDNRGRGGDINITAALLQMEGGGRIVTETGQTSRPRRGGSGTGGNIRIDVETMRLSGHKPVDPVTPTGLRSLALERTDGNAGDVSITAGVLSVLDGAAIQADTRGTGSAGLVTIDATDITIRGKNKVFPENALIHSRISSLTESGATNAGRGGSILIDAQVLRVDGGGTITARSTTGAKGSAGLIQLTGQTIAIGGGGLIEASTAADSTGNGGDIRLGTRSRPIERLVINAGLVSAATNGSGNGGEVTGNVEELIITRRGAIKPDSTGIGTPGRLRLNISRLAVISEGGSIQSSAEQTNGGDIQLRGTSDLAALELLSNSQISTRAPADGRDGGDVMLLLDRAVVIDRATVTTSSGGGGGNIVLEPEAVVLRGAVLNANAIAEDGGNITIDALRYLRDPATRITADSQLALPGTIAITSNAIDLSGVLTPLFSGLGDASARIQDQCKLLKQDNSSSLTIQPRGGAAQ